MSPLNFPGQPHQPRNLTEFKQPNQLKRFRCTPLSFHSHFIQTSALAEFRQRLGECLQWFVGLRLSRRWKPIHRPAPPQVKIQTDVRCFMPNTEKGFFQIKPDSVNPPPSSNLSIYGCCGHIKYYSRARCSAAEQECDNDYWRLPRRVRLRCRRTGWGVRLSQSWSSIWSHRPMSIRNWAQDEEFLLASTSNYIP